MKKRTHLPIVYSCSGCSNVAQLANSLAIALDRENAAEMSCIAGVGGDVPSLVRVAQSDRPILAIDGCPLQCVKSVLAKHGVTPATHVKLHEFGLRKKYGQDHTSEDVDQTLPEMRRAAQNLISSTNLAQKEPANDRA